MNTLSIVIKNLKNFIIKHTVVFIIMFIALIISTITILYVVVKLDCLSDKFSAGDLSLNKIDLKNNECQLAIDDISDRFQSYYENNSSVNYVCGYLDSDEGYMGFFITDEKENLKKFSEQYKPMKGRFFSDDEIENGDEVMIIVGIGTELKSMTYDNTNFKVIGSYAPNNMANGYLTQKSLIKNNIIPTTYSIVFDKELSVQEIKEYKKELEELFPEFKIETTMDYISENAPVMLDFENICLLLMVIAAIISCAYLYSFILQMRVNKIYIFKLCGASPGNLMKIFFSEMIALLIMQFGVAFIIFRVILINVLKKYDVAFYYGYSRIHVIIAFLIIFVLCLLIFIPVLFYYCKKNAIQIKQKMKG